MGNPKLSCKVINKKQQYVPSQIGDVTLGEDVGEDVCCVHRSVALAALREKF